MRLDALFQPIASLLKRSEVSSPSSQPTPSLASAMQGVRVQLSSQGSERMQAEGRDKDIENSNLPDVIKQSLRQIRMLKRLIAEKQAEMARLEQANPEKNRDKIEALRHQLLSFNGALVGAMTDLANFMRKLKLDPQQMMEASNLAIKNVKPQGY